MTTRSSLMTSGNRAPVIGLAVIIVIIVLAVFLPPLLGWDIAARRDPVRSAAPLHGQWRIHYDLRHLFGIGTIPAIAIAALGVRFARPLAERLGWKVLLLVAFATGLLWLFSLALVDGTPGLSRILGNPYEYLQTARSVTDIPAFLDEWISRIPGRQRDVQLRTHVAGHPPAALLFFVLLVRVGLGGDLAAGVVVTVIAATIPVAVLVAIRALGAEPVARRVAPFLVLTPAAVFLAVSADAVFAAVGAWGIAVLAVAATSQGRVKRVLLSVLAGLLLGVLVMMSYGLPLFGVLAIAVLALARRWTPLPIAAAAASAVVLLFAAYGFALWEAYPVLRERYYLGVAGRRPDAYWVWANLAAFAVSAGPMVASGTASVVAARGWRSGIRADRVVLLLAGAGLAMIALADASGMSKAEVERIWLPFAPWVTIGIAALPDRWLRPALAIQVAAAFAVQHLVYTGW